MTGTYAVDVLDGAGLQQLDAAQWNELSRRAIDDNPFYARSYVLAGLETIDGDGTLQAVAVREGGSLVGLFPFRRKRWPLEHAMAAGNLYQLSSQPLIHRDHAGAVVGAWLGALRQRKIPRYWTFLNICLSSQFLHHCRSLGGGGLLELIPSGSYARATLVRIQDGFDAHLRSVVSKSRVKDIERTIRRLRETGHLSFERQREPERVAQRIEDFLTMEHSGWKGRAGTSFLASESHAEFARRAFRGEGCARTFVDSLILDGRPIAISINMQAGDTVFTPKCAYDEAFRKFSPGLVLEYLILEAFYREDEIVDMDSSTTAKDHVIQGLWNGEKPMGSMLIGPPGWQIRSLALMRQVSMAVWQGLKDRIGSDKLVSIRATLRRWRFQGKPVQSKD